MHRDSEGPLVQCFGKSFAQALGKAADRPFQTSETLRNLVLQRVDILFADQLAGTINRHDGENAGGKAEKKSGA